VVSIVTSWSVLDRVGQQWCKKRRNKTKPIFKAFCFGSIFSKDKILCFYA